MLPPSPCTGCVPGGGGQEARGDGAQHRQRDPGAWRAPAAGARQVGQGVASSGWLVTGDHCVQGQQQDQPADRPGQPPGGGQGRGPRQG